MPHVLVLILLLLAASVVVVIACRLLRLPPILGYLVVGIVVGPHAMAWVPDTVAVRDLAEFGIVFLMFSIGLEFSLPQLKIMSRAVFGLGLAQVAITTVMAMVGLHFVHYGWLAGFALGGALAMSSTAIVSKMLAERNELTTPHGRDVMGVLLFQDLAVVAFLVATPTLAEGGSDLWKSLAIAGGKAALALAVILFFGQRPMRAWFTLVARLRSPELFMLNVLLVTLGLAAATEMAGLSYALGAFLAGMLIAETEYRYQVEEDIKPFRDVLLGLFFVTVGMYLDLHVVWSNIGWVLLLLFAPVLAKIVLVVILARLFGSPLGAALRTGFYLGQAGEFAIVLLALATDLGVVDATMAQLVLAAMVLSMLSAPFIIQFSEPVVKALTANDWLARAAQVTQIAARTMARQEHVIICGYGRSGQNLARVLGAEEIAFIALDSDPERVSEAADSNVVYGDASRREALIAAGLAKARAVAVTLADVPLALKIIHLVRQERPEVPVIVRTLDDSELERLLKAGAAEVVPEVLEGSLMLATHSLLLLGVPLGRVLDRIRAVREEHYSLFRGFFHGTTDAADAENLQSRLHTVLLTARSKAVGKSLTEIDLSKLAEVTAVRRHGLGSSVPQATDRFEAGDVVVLFGRPSNLALAERRLLRG
ncbi:MAG: cation:proton antiporter [Betaproteobacteria bacterium]